MRTTNLNKMLSAICQRAQRLPIQRSLKPNDNPTDPTPASVLVPIIDHAEPTLLLTERSKNLRKHAGQVSFPGGKQEQFDDSALSTALRETEEEIGLSRDHIQVIGQLNQYQTGSGFLMTPFIALCEKSAPLKPQAVEVSEIFEVPLSFAFNANNHKRVNVEYENCQYHYYVLQYEKHKIWGATAAIIIATAKLYHELRH